MPSHFYTIQVTFIPSYVIRKEVKPNNIFTVALTLSQHLDHSITADIMKEPKILKTKMKKKDMDKPG